MAYIKDIQIDNNTYLIEPLLHIIPNIDDNHYSATLANFELVSGVTISMEIATSNPVAPTLNINSTGDKTILYDNNSLTAGMLESGKIYQLIYTGQSWNVIGNLTIPLATNNIRGGVQIGYTIDENNKNYPVQLDNEKMFVHVPWEPLSKITWNSILDTPTTLEGYGITDAHIENNVITIGSETISPIIDINGKVADTYGAVELTASDIGLTNPLQFKGVVRSDSQFQPSDESAGIPTLNGISNYRPNSGDVIFDKDGMYEYVYTDGNIWELIGGDGPYKVVQTEIRKPTEVANRWVSSIGQDPNGVIEVLYADIDMTEDWTGNAATATKLLAPQKVYVDLSTTSQTTTIRGGDTDAEVIGVDGVLGVQSGGTGVSSFNTNQVVLTHASNITGAFTSRAYLDNDSGDAQPISSSSHNFVTESYIYYGLPTINGAHNYDADSDFFAPTTNGSDYQILVSDGSASAPVWAAHARINSDPSQIANTNAYTTLTLGNNENATSTNSHSEGQIELYSAATHKHILQGDSTTADYTHIFPNSNGYLVQMASAAAVGSPTNPVYVAANGIVTALTYTANRLYFSAATNSFEATNHYASESQIGLGTTTLPENCSDTLYVSGSTSFNGIVKLLNNIYFGFDTYGVNYYIDDDAVGYLPDLRVDKVQLDDDMISFYAVPNAGTDEDTGDSVYAFIEGISSKMIFHHNASSPIFEFNGDLLPSTTSVYDLGSNTYRWNNTYLQGNLYMQTLAVPGENASIVSNKILWQNSYNDAEIYFVAEQRNEAAKLVLNSTRNINSTIAISFVGEDTAYINYSTPSFYPAITNSGELGISTNRWNKLYIGSNDTHGDPYTPIYWHDGAPEVITPVLQCNFAINNAMKGVRLASNAFTVNSYVIQIVVTGGESNLNTPISWASDTGYIDLTCSVAVSGAVNGYIIVSRGGTITATAADIV